MSVFHQLRKGPLKISVIGAGNWGTVISNICAKNAKSRFLFDPEVVMWALEQDVEESVNKEHTNHRYLPGFPLAENLKCSTNLEYCTSRADLLVIVVPHQFLISTVKAMKPFVNKNTSAISLVKGLHITDQFIPVTFSEIIETELGISCCCLSGANVANDIAKEQFCETTIGYDGDSVGAAPMWQELFDTPNFKVRCVPDRAGVQFYGSIKNLIAIAAGFCDAIGAGTNTKAAIMRLGCQDAQLFTSVFMTEVSSQSFFESCGFADLITTCFGGRNVRCAAEFIKRGGGDTKLWKEIEADMLGGQFLQGTLTCKEVADILKHYDIFDYFPLFKATYEISFEGAPVERLIDIFRHENCDAESIVASCDKPIQIPSSMSTLLKRIPSFIPPKTTDKLGNF